MQLVTVYLLRVGETEEINKTFITIMLISGPRSAYALQADTTSSGVLTWFYSVSFF